MSPTYSDRACLAAKSHIAGEWVPLAFVIADFFSFSLAKHEIRLALTPLFSPLLAIKTEMFIGGNDTHRREREKQKERAKRVREREREREKRGKRERESISEWHVRSGPLSKHSLVWSGIDDSKRREEKNPFSLFQRMPLRCHCDAEWKFYPWQRPAWSNSHALACMTKCRYQPLWNKYRTEIVMCIGKNAFTKNVFGNIHFSDKVPAIAIRWWFPQNPAEKNRRYIDFLSGFSRDITLVR